MKLGYLVVAVVIVSALAFLYYTYAFPGANEGGGIVVAVSIAPQADFVKHVAGDGVEVVVMVPPNADPHTYEPTPSQLEKVSKAKIYFMVGSGLGFERAWMDKLVDLNPNMLLVNGSEGISLMDGDPHVWLSPKNAKVMVLNFYEGLVKVDPAHKDEYKENLDRYLEELDSLDAYIRDRLSGYEERAFLVYHPAFGYFARDYNLTQLSVEREGKPPSPATIESCIELAKEHHISYVFVEPQFPTDQAKVIAEEIGGRIEWLDPMPEDYVSGMKLVADRVAEELG